MFRAAILSSVLLLLAGQAQAKDEWRTVCPPHEDGFGPCILKFTGSEDATRIQANGGELIRVFIKKDMRVNSPILIIEAVLTAKGDARLIMRDPLEPAVNRSYALDRSRFDALREQVRSLRFEGASLHGGDSRPEPLPDNQVCLDPASARVDVVLDGNIAAADMDYCSNDDAAFLDNLLDIAASMESDCIASFKSWPADKLRECLHIARKPE